MRLADRLLAVLAERAQDNDDDSPPPPPTPESPLLHQAPRSHAEHVRADSSTLARCWTGLLYVVDRC